MREIIQLTNEQRLRVEENIGLVGKVIADKIRDVSKIGLFTYDDLFQIGCEGLCKASKTFCEGGAGKFSTYAYRVIFNQLCDAIRYSSVRARNEAVVDQDVMERCTVDMTSEIEVNEDVYAMLDAALEGASDTICRGVKAIILRAEGYTPQDICMELEAQPGTIRIWITRARRYINKRPEFEQMAISMGLV